ncbi:MAG TPA: DUF418 domain-containing protein [Blastocatellia bacterium]|nr:DUF418 domain-containing protein [Blastocatellia bacterium]
MDIPPPSLSLGLTLCFVPPGTFACWFVAVFRAHHVWRDTFGECALRCLLPSALFSLERPVIRCSGKPVCAPGCLRQKFVKRISPSNYVKHRGDEFSAAYVESQISPVSLQERIEILDVLRGLAVCGILIGNMQWFSGYGMMPPSVARQGPIGDQITHFLVHFFVEGKFYSIFSFLFGFGFALQIARAEERGDLKASLFKRRLFWLLVIGLLHAYLLWAGDILSVYALMGFVLVLFRKKTNGPLLKWAFGLLVVPILTYVLLYILFVAFVSPEAVAKLDAAQIGFWNESVKKVSRGSYLQIITDFNLNYIVGRYASLLLEMRLPKILAMFLLGFYAYRRGVFNDLSGHRPFIRRVFVYGLILGLVGNFAFAAFAGAEAVLPPSPAGIVGVISYAFGVPALALFFIGLVATLWQRAAWRRLFVFLAPVGRMALTNYLLQTVICVLIFYGYGFGQFGRFGATTATLIALAIFMCQILMSALWLKYFSYGPLEWIWRQFTYRRRLDLRLKRQPTTVDSLT